MKVKELQEKLKKLDPELEVFCYSVDENLLIEDRGFILFNISYVDTTDADRLRLDDGTPYLKFANSSKKSTVATLEVTSNF